MECHWSNSIWFLYDRLRFGVYFLRGQSCFDTTLGEIEFVEARAISFPVVSLFELDPVSRAERSRHRDTACFSRSVSLSCTVRPTKISVRNKGISEKLSLNNDWKCFHFVLYAHWYQRSLFLIVNLNPPQLSRKNLAVSIKNILG